MLSTFNKKKARYLIVFFASSWLWIARADTPMMLLDKVIATVDEEQILYSDLEELCEQLQSEGKVIDQDIKKNLLHGLISNKLFLAKARIDEIKTPISESAIQRQCNDLLATWIKQIGSEEQLVQVFHKPIRQIKAMLKRNLEENALVSEVKRKLIESVEVTPAEVKAYFEGLPPHKRIYYPTSFEIQKLVIYAKVAPDRIEAAQYKSPTPEEITLAKVALERIRQEVVQGTLTMEEAIQRYSEDQATRSAGGLITYNRDGEQLLSALVSIEYLEPEVYSAIEGLQEGAITEPIFIDKDHRVGWQLFYLKRKVEAHLINLAQDYAIIHHRLLQQKQEQALQKWTQTARETFFIHVDYQDIH